MIHSIFAKVIAAALYMTSAALTPHAAASQIALTHVLPQQHFVAFKVDKTESLKDVAKSVYGSDEYWTTVWNDNASISNPDSVQNGQTLKVRSLKPTEPENLSSDLVVKEAAMDDQAAEKEAEKENEAYLQRIGYLPSATPKTDSPTVTPAPTTNVSAVPAAPSAPVVVASAAAVAPAAPTSFMEVYKDAGAKYGVPWQILYGLHQTETGGRDGAISSGHGPEGPMQFMPGTFAAYAVDGNGDGQPNIDNAVDAIYTAANFIAKHGSVSSALASWGGNTAGTLSLARAQGYSN